MLEMQRHAMLMYTSCGWFFDEISGMETVQVIQYAARSIQLAQVLFGDHREEKFIELLAHAPTNIPEYLNGAEVYRRFAKPAMVNLLGVGAHYAISALFRGFEQHSSIYAYEVQFARLPDVAGGTHEGCVGSRGDPIANYLAPGGGNLRRFASRATTTCLPEYASSAGRKSTSNCCEIPSTHSRMSISRTAFALSIVILVRQRIR